MNHKKSLSALLAASLIAGGCQAAPAVKDSSTPSSQTGSGLSSSDESKKPVAAVNLSDEQQTSLFKFSWSLFDQIHQADEDTLVSPLSAFFALGMAADGAAGQTKQQMLDAIGVDADVMNELARSAIATAAGENKQLGIANSIWADDVEFKADYQKLLKDNFAAEGFKTAFDADAAQQMNKWVSEKTDGQIPNMVSPDEIANMSVMLINALNFDAKWEEPYEGEQIGTFYFTDAQGNGEEVESLFSEEDQYIETDHLYGFIRPYEGGRYAFAAMIPQNPDETLEDALKTIDPAALEEILRNPKEREVKAHIPSFTFEGDMSLNGALESMGVTDAFTPSADFSAMAEEINFRISQVKQKTKITLDAQGTKAAAATTVTMEAASALIEEEPPVTIVCDQPFLYMILDRESGTPVFIGTQTSIPQTPEK